MFPEMLTQGCWYLSPFTSDSCVDSLSAPYSYQYILLERQKMPENNVLQGIFESQSLNRCQRVAFKILNTQVTLLCSEQPLMLEREKNTDWELCRLQSSLGSKPQLVTFDMDSTLIGQEVIDEIAREANCYEKVAAITESAMRGELDFNQSLKKRVACLKGLKQETLFKVYERLSFSPGAEELLRKLNQWHVKTAILSGGFDFFAKRIAQTLNIPIFYSNQLEIEQGVLTGRVVGEIIDAEAKSFYLKKLAQEYGIDLCHTMAVGDGANDLKVLQSSGMGVAWHAKPAVALQADLAINYLGLEALTWIWA